MIGYPFESPVGLFSDAGDCETRESMQYTHGSWGANTGVNGVEKVCSLFLFFDVCIDEQGVCLRVDILHHDLETVEAACLGYLHFTAETLDKIFIDDAIRSGEEGENVGDEIALVVIQSIIPVVEVFGEVNFFGGPEGGFRFLVHLPYLIDKRHKPRNNFPRGAYGKHKPHDT